MSQEVVHTQYSAHLKAANLAPLSARMADELGALFDEAPVAWQAGGLFAFVARFVFTAGTGALFGRGTGSGNDALAAFQRFDRQFPLLVAGVPARLLGQVERSRQLLAGLVGRLRPDASA